ncbi:VspD [Photorhabdus heterorhabditis]|uniref:VspD n=1 Tax=Photorhabdus heterorhabditis TaxID=880156 RepID=A0A5B0XBM2_9GAMM|nr:VspD [Photorhabdus heterorhabditis]KAA1195509.1 VspD [Photorhabdus heterorhabditis]KOY62982.1 VspD [Photorhabdus heterorhabditis]
MTSINVISDVGYIRTEENKEQQLELQKSGQKGLQPSASPSQPLPGSTLSENALWRMIAEAAKTLANGMSGTAKENSEAKKALIATLKDAQIAQLNERMQKLEEQAAAEKKKGFWGKLGMALGFIAAIVIAPFNPVMAAVMIGTMVAAIVVPKVVDKILEACGVDEKIRNWVNVSLEVIIGIVGAVLSFNPGNILASASKTIASTTAKAVELVEKAMNVLKSFKAFNTIAGKAQNIINKALKLLEPLFAKIQELAKGGKLAAARIGQVTSASSDVVSVVGSGYAIKSASVMKDLEVSKAEQEEMEARFQQLQIMLSTAMKALTKSFESLFKIKSDEREFNQKMLSIHL